MKALELLFCENPIGQVTLAHEVLDNLVSRALPLGVTIVSIRYREQDRLCLVLLSDRRNRFDAEQDQACARLLVARLKDLGVERPRVQWVRATPESELRELKLRRSSVIHRPLFWAFLFLQLQNWIFMDWPDAMLATTLGGAAWQLAHWFLREQGLDVFRRWINSKVRGAK